MTSKKLNPSTASIRRGIWIMGIVSLIWSISFYVHARGCFGVLRECEIEPLAASGWGAALSIPLWLATFTLHKNSLLAKVLRVICALYLGAFSVLGFSYVTSKFYFWAAQETQFQLIAACFIYLPYFLGLFLTLFLMHRILLDFRRSRRVPASSP